MQINQATTAQLQEWEAELSSQYQSYQSAALNLDLTRGKPSADQLSLSDELDGILKGDFKDGSGTDVRNYGGLDGLPEAKALFANMLDVAPEQVLIGGNSSLTLMYTAVNQAMYLGINGPESAWSREQGTIKFLCPVPGYDRHFGICEDHGIEMITVGMNDDGPDMDAIEAHLKADPQIKGIWCVPRFSNPTGHTYSDEVVERFAQLGKIAGDNFRIFWDNAYSVHILEEGAPELTSLLAACERHGTEDSVYIFGSTSKITFAGAGVAFMGASANNLNAFKKHLNFASIGPDKVNQLRHIRLLKDADGLQAHMLKHAALLKPRFDIVLKHLNEGLSDSGLATWTEPKGGYFISLDTLPGLAQEVVKLAADAGVKLTPAGATFPYGNDPENRNIRIAPSVPSVEEIDKAMAVFVTCVKLASVRQALQTS